MIKFRYLLFVLCFFFVMSGCANKMALTKGQDKVDLSKKSIVLFSFKISNLNKPDYQLELRGTFICPQSKKCSTGPYYHIAEGPYKSEKGLFNEYLLSFELDPATYNIHAPFSPILRMQQPLS